jgi:hypothetical protein
MGSVSIPTIAAIGAEGSADAAAGAGAAAAASTAAAGTAATISAGSVAASIGTGAEAATALGSALPAAGSVFTGANLAAGVGALGSAVSAYGQRQQGIATANMDANKARVAQIQGAQQQINMRQKMLASLASQNAGTLGAVGTGAASSFGANAMRQITQNQNDLEANSADTSAQVSLLDQGAGNAIGAGNLAAGGTALGGAAGFAKNFNFGGS